ncbi:hypothetical protein C0995_012001 [Termitomyces sp. Mi166|nr:hypothetical protein C0995_012001 [Termitomyces sp. Mi166\
MTDLDDHCGNRNLRANTIWGYRTWGYETWGNNQTAASSSERPIGQPAAAANPFSMVIPETHLLEDWDAPLQSPMPRMVSPSPAPVHRRDNMLRPPVNQPIVAISEIHLPEWWDTPLQNPMPRMVPPIPTPAPLQNPMPRIVPPPLAPIYIQKRQYAETSSDILLWPKSKRGNKNKRGILQGWEQQHQADLEEDFNGLNSQNDIPPEEELEYVDAAFDQIVENALEYLEQPADNGDDPRQQDPPAEPDDPAVHMPAEGVEPPLILLSPK